MGTSSSCSSLSPGKNTQVRNPRHESILDVLWKDGFCTDSNPNPWRVGSHPFLLTKDQISFFQVLGDHLLTFYQALNRLYLDSLRGLQPFWVHEYLDQGKPEDLISFARMNRFRDLLPDVIRPDVIPTENGMMMTELDSIPGGIGLTGSLSEAYASLGDVVVGGNDGMVEAFATMIKHRAGDRPWCLAIVVSDESEAYRPEMQWLACQLIRYGIESFCVHPKEVLFTEEGLRLPERCGGQRISIVYRFFELFDLKNIPKAELIMYSAKKGNTVVTPPYKPWLEEKLAFALIHHPKLASYWTKTLGQDTFHLLTTLMPHTWVLDPSPVPPTATIPGLSQKGQAVSNWRELGSATQKERHYVIKPSGYSELAWGSRGVSIGHDLPQSEWISTLDTALNSFASTPYILQEFHKGRQYTLEYFEESTNVQKPMGGRVRLSPYYFVYGDRVKLGGILATICPKDKKVIHGMRDAIMVPCGIMND